MPPQDAHNLLRPESVESFYLLWKASGDPQYKEWAWQVGGQAPCQPRRWPCAHACMQPCMHAAMLRWLNTPYHRPQHAAAVALRTSTRLLQVFRALEKWTRVDASTRHKACAACLAQQAQDAAEAARASGQGGGGDAAAVAAGLALPRADACRACSTSGGYSSLESVLEVPPRHRDKARSRKGAGG